MTESQISIDDNQEDRGNEGEATGIQIDNLTKNYGETVAVDEVTLDIYQGELLVLLGPSGCGKSTTLRLIAGLEVPDSGTISINGKDVTDSLPKDRDLSMVFQNYALYPHKTVKGNLKFPLNKMEISEEDVEEKIQRTAELLDITDILEKKPSKLSGGQRQRVALGRTIVREPSVFLMDEPLSNLDAKLRVSTRSEISSLQKQLETTTVYVTHDQEEAMSIADRIAVIHEGKPVQIGTPRQIYQTPANEFVARFIGSPAMNILDRSTNEIDAGFLPDHTSSVGFRPESAYIESESSSNAENQIQLSDFEISLIQPLGNGYEVTVRKGNYEFIIISKSKEFDLGETVDIKIEMDDMHCFDDDGNRVKLKQ